MRIRFLITLAAAIVIAGCQTSGKDRKKGPRNNRAVKQFNLMDLDRDGQLPRSEALAYNAGKFGKTDTDGSGSLSISEYQRGKSDLEQAEYRFSGLDLNRDKLLTLEETQIEINGFFSRFDGNGDDVVTLAELQKSETGKRSGKRKKGQGGRRRKGG